MTIYVTLNQVWSFNSSKLHIESLTLLKWKAHYPLHNSVSASLWSDVQSVWAAEFRRATSTTTLISHTNPPGCEPIKCPLGISTVTGTQPCSHWCCRQGIKGVMKEHIINSRANWINHILINYSVFAGYLNVLPPHIAANTIATH